MRTTFGAVNVAMRADGSLQLDPTALDEEASRAHCTFVYQSSGGAPSAGSVAATEAEGGGTEPPLLSSVQGGGSFGEEAFWQALEWVTKAQCPLVHTSGAVTDVIGFSRADWPWLYGVQPNACVKELMV